MVVNLQATSSGGRLIQAEDDYVRREGKSSIFDPHHNFEVQVDCIDKCNIYKLRIKLGQHDLDMSHQS